MRHFSILPALATLTAVAHCSQAPAPTSPPEYPAEHHLEIRQTTSYYSLVTTEIPKDEFSIGMGQNGTGGNYCQSQHRYFSVPRTNSTQIGCIALMNRFW